MPVSSLRSTKRGRRRAQGGQSVVELALGLPLALMPMLFIVVNAGTLTTNKVNAMFASRQGARLAAQLGNGQLSNPTMSTIQIDTGVVQAVLTSAANLSFATVTEVDIYQADAAGAPANGSFDPATEPYDSYNATYTQLHQTFPNTARIQVPPGETSIGVNLKFTFTGLRLAVMPFTMTLSEYSVMKAAAAPAG